MEITEIIKTLGFEEPEIMLLTIPAVLILYFYLVYNFKKEEQIRQRRNYLIVRSVVVFLLFAALSLPFVEVPESTSQSAVTILLDKSASMNLYENYDSGVYGLYENLRNSQEFVTINNFSYGDRTAIGDALYLGSLNPAKNNVIILISQSWFI